MHIQFDNDTSTVCVNVEICLLSITHTCSNVNTLSGLKNLNVYNCLSLNSCCLSWVNEMNWIRYTGTCTVPVYVFCFFLIFLSFFLITCRGVKCRFNNYHHHLLTQQSPQFWGFMCVRVYLYVLFVVLRNVHQITIKVILFTSLF